MLRKVSSVVLIASLAAVAVSSPLTYAFRPVTVRSAVVVVDSQQVAANLPGNPTPYVLFNLDSNKTIKPGGWNFTNPSAPTRVTPEIKARWDAINAVFGGGASANVGDPITKRNAAFWELRLSTASESQLAQYDFLVFPVRGFVQLNSLEREKLRRFMESGGVLWVDFQSGVAPYSFSFDVINGLPLGFGITSNSLGLTPGTDGNHPLLNRPNPVLDADLVAMDSQNTLSFFDGPLNTLGVPTDVLNLQQTTNYEAVKFSPITQDVRGAKIVVGQVGEGYMVVTTRGVATTINRVITPGGAANVNVLSEGVRPASDRNADAAARLAVNMVYLTASSPQSGKGSRKGGGNSIEVGAPLLKRFSENRNFTTGTPGKYSTPAVYKGLAIVTTQDQIFVYDANPSNDLNNDGDPDDGILDYAIGADRDLIWVSQPLPGPISSPTAAEVPDGNVVNQVAVVDGQGQLRIFDALPANPGPNMVPVASAGPPTPIDPDFGSAGAGPYAPTFHDGQYFIADQITTGIQSTGRVWMADARNGQVLNAGGGNWAVGSTTTPVMGRPSGSPTVGYIPIADGSGGLDRVVYVPTRSNAVGGPNSTAAIHSIWLGAKGEKPTGFAVAANSLFVIPRAQTQGLQPFNANGPHPLGLKLTILDANGNALNAAQMDTLFDGTINVLGGQLAFPFRAGQNLPTGATVRLDYTINWGVNQPGYGLQLIRGQLFMPDNSQRQRRIVGNIALSPEGIIHVVHSAPEVSTAGGAYYAFREDSRGQFKMLTRYELYREHTITLNQAAPQQYRETLADNDPITQIPGVGAALGGRFTGLRFVSGPTVHNGTVYIQAQGRKNGFPQAFIPFNIMMAFNANPSAAEVVVGELGQNFSVLQPDLSRSENPASPTVLSVLSQGQFTYEKDSGASAGVIRFDNLMQNTRGAVGNSINLSQPIIIRVPGRPDQLVEPNRTGDRWSPLRWYLVQHGAQGGVTPIVTGGTLFWMVQSTLPSLVRAGFVINPGSPPVATPIIYGMDADISATSPFLGTDSVRPWQRQLAAFSISPTFAGNPALRWPQNSGLTSFEDWAIRLLQTEIPNSQQAPLSNDVVAVGLAGGEDSLVGLGRGAIVGFRRADFIVADEGRLVRVDASGNPVWSSDATVSTSLSGDFGTAITTRPLVRPTKAYVQNAREMFVVDTGANRVIRLDQSGRETRSIERVRLDATFLPDGFMSNDPLELREPRDVIVYTSSPQNQTTFSNPQPREYWIHYLIADSGNRRVVEVVDRYRVNPTTGRIEGVVNDANGQPGLGVLLWHSPSTYSKKNFDYHSLARVYYYDNVNEALSRYIYAAGIGASMPARADLGLDAPSSGINRESQDGNGGVVVFDGPRTIVINQVTVPPLAANVYWDFAAGAWNSIATPGRTKRLGNLNSVTMRNIIDPVSGLSKIAIMFTDSEGVFEIIQPGAAVGSVDPNLPWVVRWMMTKESYRALRRTVPANVPTNSNPRDFRPTYARRLDSGEVLLVNGWQGTKRDSSAFSGEVLQVSGDIDLTNNPLVEGFSFSKLNLGFNTFSIRVELPPITGTRDLFLPVFADRR